MPVIWSRKLILHPDIKYTNIIYPESEIFGLSIGVTSCITNLRRGLEWVAAITFFLAQILVFSERPPSVSTYRSPPRRPGRCRRHRTRRCAPASGRPSSAASCQGPSQAFPY